MSIIDYPSDTEARIFWKNWVNTMGLLPNTQNCVLHMRRECRERFPRHPEG